MNLELDGEVDWAGGLDEEYRKELGFGTHLSRKIKNGEVEVSHGEEVALQRYNIYPMSEFRNQNRNRINSSSSTFLNRTGAAPPTVQPPVGHRLNSIRSIEQK